MKIITMTLFISNPWRKTCFVGFIFSCLTGCQLKPNLAQPSYLVQAQFNHWIDKNQQTTQHEIQQYLNEKKTAFLILDDAFLSIAARIYLISQAKTHLDLQYYIWKNDEVGQLMLAELLKAADRGVKVRLLIDDQNGTQLDDALTSLITHPNFEVKLFNPYKYRHFRALDYGLRALKINHRMHNKLIVADGAMAITGGRNISREYFDASEEFQFTDLDVLFFGTASQQANESFLQFWNDQLSYPIQNLVNN